MPLYFDESFFILFNKLNNNLSVKSILNKFMHFKLLKSTFTKLFMLLSILFSSTFFSFSFLLLLLNSKFLLFSLLFFKIHLSYRFIKFLSTENFLISLIFLSIAFTSLKNSSSLLYLKQLLK